MAVAITRHIDHPPHGPLSPRASAAGHFTLGRSIMHVRDLVELAGVISTHCREFAFAGDPVPRRGVAEFYAAAQCRQQPWIKSLAATWRALVRLGEVRRQAHWDGVAPVVEEVLAAEVLTRVWAAAAAARDAVRGESELEPVARNVLAAHFEARNAALRLILYGEGFSVPQAQRLNRLRHKAERWTDFLLAPCLEFTPLTDLAFDAERTAEFFAEGLGAGGGHELAASLAAASRRAAFTALLASRSPGARLHRRVAAGLLRCLPAALLDDCGLPHALWMVRLGNKAADAEELIEQLAANEGNHTGVGSGRT
jgi:hypothetical protein